MRYALAAALVVLGAYVGQRLWPKELQVRPSPAMTPAVMLETGGAAAPGQIVTADVATFQDEWFAFLMRGYLSTATRHPVLLTYEKVPDGIEYIIRMELGSDWVAAVDELARLKNTRRIQDYYWRAVAPETLIRFRGQNLTFDQAYSLSRRSLEKLSRKELAAYLRRYIRFKAHTDPRIRKGMEPQPKPPTQEEAHQLAQDILEVTEFFGIPLDFFLGIGAMENNYMNVKGDLGNTIWKRRPEKGDVVLKRGRRGVLVLNQSSGIWQITQETLRYAHRLYLKDTRDYTKLPEHLRPPRELNLDELPSEALTTYAGLFFRDLLDYFAGDIASAVGAYNGGPGRPNSRYEEGVRTVADHARRVLEHAAALHGRQAAQMRFMSAR